MSMILTLKKIVSMLLTVFYLFLSAGMTGESYSTKNPEEVKLNFTVMSDCHIESNNFETYRVFSKMLMSASECETENDAVIFLGDNTMNGQDIESMVFFGLVDTITPAKEVLMATGNHDLSNGEGDYDTYVNRFMSYNNAFFENKIDKPYYYKVIDDCYFIVMSSEDATVNTSYISDEQFSWLKGLLDEAQEKGAPVFIFHHHPVESLEGREYWELSELLNDYDNLLYFYGHTHLEMTEASFAEINGVNTIGLPRSTEHAYDDYDCGVGVQVELYENEVVVRARSYYEDRWIENLEYSYPLV